MKISKEQGTNSFKGLTSTCSCWISCYCSISSNSATSYSTYYYQNYNSSVQNANPY